MRKLFLFLTVALVGISSTQAEQTNYERRAFERRYGLWGNVRCMADSVSMYVEIDRSVAAEFSETQMKADAKSHLDRLMFPKHCDPRVTPEPATMVSLEVDIRTVVDEDGSLAYFVRLRALMPDGDFTRHNFGQHTGWESSGKLGHARLGSSREALGAAMSEQIEEFAAFMRRARQMGKDRAG